MNIIHHDHQLIIRYLAFSHSTAHALRCICLTTHHLHVVLDHITNGAGLLGEATTALDAEALGHRDLHALDIVSVPERFEESVREAEDQKVLDRLLPEIMVDAEDARFIEDTRGVWR